MDGSNIAWCDATFNIVWGCAKVSPGCKNCYAETLAHRRLTEDVWGEGKERRTLSARYWKGPPSWNRRAAKEGTRLRVFCGSMCDVFENHPTVAAERARLWRMIRMTSRLDWLLLTKRPENIEAMLPNDWGEGYPNVWLGTSIENLDFAWRASKLREIPATIRFISYEPALGPLVEPVGYDDPDRGEGPRFSGGIDLAGIDWLIYGGESGAGYRDDDVRWARDIGERCREELVAFFYKQKAALRPGTGDLDGEVVQEFPVGRRVPLRED